MDRGGSKMRIQSRTNMSITEKIDKLNKERLAINCICISLFVDKSRLLDIVRVYKRQNKSVEAIMPVIDYLTDDIEHLEALFTKRGEQLNDIKNT